MPKPARPIPWRRRIAAAWRGFWRGHDVPLPLSLEVQVAPAGSTVVMVSAKVLSPAQRSHMRAWLEMESARTGVHFVVLDGCGWRVATAGALE